MRLFFIIPLTFVAAAPALAPAAGIRFSREIRPILSENCFFCHGPDEKKREADLRLDEEGSAKRDNKGTTVVVPGHPEKSALIERIFTTNEDDVMPPLKQHKTLTAAQKELLKEWIRQGAQWGKHWSYETVVRPEVPKADAGAGNAIDAFLRERLAKDGLKPAAEAEAGTLIRRVALDLTGLPPTLEELARFMPRSGSHLEKAAYEAMVDFYLNKPAFGEHWARMWLDLARYADSAGYPSDPGREIWSYRDWVIQAFNRNQPFDQFTIEQMAGDLLPNPSNDQLIATAFHRNTMTQNEGGTSDEEFRNAAVIDRVNTTLAVWMGTTMACAQCHTHKYDPISNKEYFEVYAFLNQSADADKKDESPLLEFYTPELKQQQKDIQAKLASLESHFVRPEAKWLAGLEAWDAGFARNLGWEQPKPLAVTTASKKAATIQDDGAITVAKGADQDTYTVELPAGGSQISALRLDTVAAAGSGNFVVTDVKAEVVPAAATQAPQARFARIELPGKGKMLQLAEVQVFSGAENVALNGTATQSSQYAEAAAKRANDGKTDGDYAKGSVSHTAGTDDNPWWEVDLKSAKAINRLVVWNRTDGGTASRMEGFRVVLLDEKRQTVWSSAGNAAPPVKKEFAIGGPVPIVFTTALADYEQTGFTAASVLKAKDKTNQGWAVAGATDKPHALTLLASSPVVISPGAKLRVLISQNSEYKQHTLGQFRLSYTGNSKVQEVTSLPGSLVTALNLVKEKRTPEQQAAIADYYVRNVAKEAAPERKQKMALTKQMEKIKPITVPVMKDLTGKDRRVTHMQLRGNWEALGEEVKEGVPAAFPPLPANAPRNRLTLAQWLVSRQNPLTARVTVNRFWESLFGTGIVRSSEDFGSQGDLPVHPELLDWMAAEFMESGWDVKHVLKLMVMSYAYRQTSASTAALNELDPDNRLLARGPRFRPTGEMLRDQALAVSGLLSPAMYGKPVRPLRPNLGLNTAFGGANDWVTSEGADKHRRSVYTEVKRNSPYPSFSTFDAPNREVCTIRRGRTNTPLQAFVTLNDPVFIEANQGLARRVIKEGGKDTAARLRYAFQLCLSRDANTREIGALTKLFEESAASYRQDKDGAMKMATDPIGPAEKDADIAELAAWTVVANVVMNLDEFVMRK